jgi:hypothetical protein
MFAFLSFENGTWNMSIGTMSVFPASSFSSALMADERAMLLRPSSGRSSMDLAALAGSRRGFDGSV